MDFGQMMAEALSKGQEVLAKTPESAEEAVLRLFVVNMALWDQGIEPVASHFERLVTFLSSSKDPMYEDKSLATRSAMAMLVNRMRKERNRGIEERRNKEEV